MSVPERILELRDPAELDALADLIHDCSFELADLTWDRDHGSVVIPYDRELYERRGTEASWLFLRRVRVPTYRWRLTFLDVRDCTVVDSAQVGRYDFNRVTYEEDRGIVVVETNIPLELELKVDRLHVLIDATEEVVRSRRTLDVGRR